MIFISEIRYENHDFCHRNTVLCLDYTWFLIRMIHACTHCESPHEVVGRLQRDRFGILLQRESRQQPQGHSNYSRFLLGRRG